YGFRTKCPDFSLLVGVESGLPCGAHVRADTRAHYYVMQRHTVHFSHAAVTGGEIRRILCGDAEFPRFGYGVNVCSEENELPGILLLLMLDHAAHALGGIFAAGVLHPVRRDNEYDMLRSFLLGRGGKTRAHGVYRPADGVEE